MGYDVVVEAQNILAVFINTPAALAQAAAHCLPQKWPHVPDGVLASLSGL